jgi:hypothetical protein
MCFSLIWGHDFAAIHQTLEPSHATAQKNLLAANRICISAPGGAIMNGSQQWANQSGRNNKWCALVYQAHTARCKSRLIAWKSGQTRRRNGPGRFCVRAPLYKRLKFHTTCERKSHVSFLPANKSDHVVSWFLFTFGYKNKNFMYFLLVSRYKFWVLCYIPMDYPNRCGGDCLK